MKKKSIIDLTRISREEYREMEKLPVVLLADNVRSAINIGSMLRTSDALMIGEMVMAGISAVPPSAEIAKSSLGAEESVSWRYVKDAFEEVKRLKEEGMLVLVLEQTHGSVPLQNIHEIFDKYNEANPLPTIILVVGNEVHGVDQRIVDIADYAVEIPMHGIKHSLNVSVSTGMALWELYRLLISRK